MSQMSLMTLMIHYIIDMTSKMMVLDVSVIGHRPQWNDHQGRIIFTRSLIVIVTEVYCIIVTTISQMNQTNESQLQYVSFVTDD